MPETKPDDGMKLTRTGCLVTLISVVVMGVTAIPIVQWRDPDSGEPLPRTIAILAPIVIGAVVHGLATLGLKELGWPVWSESDDE